MSQTLLTFHQAETIWRCETGGDEGKRQQKTRAVNKQKDPISRESERGREERTALRRGGEEGRDVKEDRH